MRNSLLGLLFIASITLGGSCKEKLNNNQNCNTLGEVVDMTGLDGCGLVVQLENGDKLEVVDMPENSEPLKAGEKFLFGYEEVPDLASICMVGKMIRITCISARSVRIIKGDCPTFTYATSDEMQNASKPVFNVIEHKTIGSEIHLKIGVSGCDPNRGFKLLMSRAQMRSMPPQSPCVLSFSEQACEAYFVVNLCYNLEELGGKTILLLQNGDYTERITYDPQ
ncbi:MAG: hypothetical protein JXR19_03300 [Bacteroidia bacterium]